jgi:hypothetical protein
MITAKMVMVLFSPGLTNITANKAVPISKGNAHAYKTLITDKTIRITMKISPYKTYNCILPLWMKEKRLKILRNCLIAGSNIMVSRIPDTGCICSW